MPDVNALEKASVGEDIALFADFLARLVKNDWGASLTGGAESFARRRTLNNTRSAGGGEEGAADRVHCVKLRFDKSALRRRKTQLLAPLGDKLADASRPVRVKSKVRAALNEMVESHSGAFL
jgi:hypothetical protein